jgi:hypothetical protein
VSHCHREHAVFIIKMITLVISQNQFLQRILLRSKYLVALRQRGLQNNEHEMGEKGTQSCSNTFCCSHKTRYTTKTHGDAKMSDAERTCTNCLLAESRIINCCAELEEYSLCGFCNCSGLRSSKISSPRSNRKFFVVVRRRCE